MCNYFSCIVTKTFACLWLEKSMKHEDIIEHYNINAKIAKLEAQDFVRLEINPIDNANITRNKKDWQYKIDQDGALPQWFLDNQEKAEKVTWLEWQKSILINLAIGEETIKATDKFLFACGKAKIIGYGSSSMVGYGSSSMEGYDSSSMEGYDSSCMVGHGSSCMVGYGSSRMEGYGSSRMEGYGSSRMVGYGSSSMVGYDSSCGHFYSGKFELKSKTAVIINHMSGKIIVSSDATVEVQEPLKS